MALAGNILILAELEDEDRVALESAASEAGFSATVEPSAEVAIQKLGTKRFDALVVHMGTPGAALACMRARGKLLRVRMPVIALADQEDDAHFARAYRASADEVIVLGRPADLRQRLAGLPKPSLPQPGNNRGDAVVADADRTRAEVIERVLRDAGFRVEMAMDGFAARLQAGRPSLKVAVVDASLDDVPALIAQARAKASRCAWVVRARPEQLDELRSKLASFDRVAVVSAYGPPEDVLFETNRMIESRQNDGRGDARQLYGTLVRLHFGGGEPFEIGYTYNVSPAGLFVRTLLAPPTDTLAVVVTPPGGSERVRLDARVVWRREFGATRKEPVPAGFGVQITGGDVAAWAEACPRVASLRPPSLGDRIKSVVPPSRADAATTAIPLPPAALPIAVEPVAVEPIAVEPIAVEPIAEAPASSRNDIELPPREAQTSVEQMLAQVLEQTLGDGVRGSSPLTLADTSFEPPEAPAEAKPPEKDEILSFANEPPPASARETNPLDITAASLGFIDQDDPSPRSSSRARDESTGEAVPLATPKPAEEVASSVADTIAPPPDESAEWIARSVAPAADADATPAYDIAAASTQGQGQGTPWALVSSPSPDYEAALAAAAEPERPAEPASSRQDDTMRSVPPDSGAPTSAPPASGPVSNREPRAAGRSRLVAFAILAVLGGAFAAVVMFPKGGPGPSAVAPAPGPSASPAPAKTDDTSGAPTTVTALTVGAEPSAAPVAATQAPAPSAAPETPQAAASAPPVASAAPAASAAGIAPASAVTEARPESAEEPDAAALATLQRGQGFLWVDSPLDTNVYVYGNLAGTTRQRLTQKCGPRFLRLGTAPGAWQSEGVVAVVKCGGFSRVEITP